MNTILQKRIDKAAEKYAYTNWENDDYHEGAEEGMPFDPIGYLEKCFKEAAAFALQNQWISVEEALPEDKTKVFVIVKTPVGIVHRADYHINDYWYMSRYSPEEIVTHWMQIPQLKGGEK